MKKLVVLIALMMTLSSQAMFSDTLIEGKTLATISVVEVWSNYGTFLRDSLINVRYKNADLGELMQKRGWANITSYGPKGMLSTARVNGAPSDYTSIYWNNLSLNNPALGLTDLSLVPVAFFSNISYSQINASKGIGQGAMAGAINLENKNQEKKWELSSGINSLQNTYVYSNWQDHYKSFFWQTQLKKESNKNEFSYTDSYRLRSPIINQSNNNVMQTSVMQTIGWMSKSKKNKLVVDGWYTDKSMRIPDLMGINSYYLASQKDSIIRGAFSFSHVFDSKRKIFEATKLEAGITGSREFQRYTNFIPSANEYSVFSEVRTTSLQKRVSIDNYFNSSKVQYLLEVRHTGIAVENTNYRNQEHVEPFAALNGLLHWNINPNRLFAKAFYYQEWRNNYQSVPSFGASITTVYGRKRALSVEFSAAHKFRVPDFNERFWVPGGNPNLLPERGLQGHLYAEYFLIRKNKNTLSISARYAMMQMKEMIQWVPLDVWTPVNVSDVTLQSVEGILHYSQSWSKWQLIADLRSSNNFSSTQLLYTPQSSLFASLDAVYRKWDVGVQSRWVGPRHYETTSNNPRSLDPYMVNDVFLGWKSGVEKPVLSLRFFVENIFNTRYEMVRAYALPGRVIGIQLNFYPLNFKKSS